MSLNVNQFAQSVLKGSPDLRMNVNTVSAVVSSTEPTPLVPGQAVKRVDVVGPMPIITAVVAATDEIFGFVQYDMKDQGYPASARVEISRGGNMIYLEAAAAISAGVKVCVTVAGAKVHAAVAASGEVIVGRAYDKAVNAGDLIRVEVSTTGLLA